MINLFYFVSLNFPRLALFKGLSSRFHSEREREGTCHHNRFHVIFQDGNTGEVRRVHSCPIQCLQTKRCLALEPLHINFQDGGPGTDSKVKNNNQKTLISDLARPKHRFLYAFYLSILLAGLKELVLASLNGKVQGARVHFSRHNSPNPRDLADRSGRSERL